MIGSAITGVIARLRPRLLGGVLVYDRTAPASAADLEVLDARRDELVAWLRGDRPESGPDAQLAALDELAARLPEPAGQEVREAVLLDDGRGWVLAVPADELRELEESLTRLREVRRGERPGGVGGVDTRRARRSLARGGCGPGLFGVLGAAAGREGQGEGLREGGVAAGQGSTEGIDDGAV